MNDKIRELNRAELARLLKLAQDELRLLEIESKWSNHSRWAIAHYKRRIETLNRSIDVL